MKSAQIIARFFAGLIYSLTVAALAIVGGVLLVVGAACGVALIVCGLLCFIVWSATK